MAQSYEVAVRNVKARSKARFGIESFYELKTVKVVAPEVIAWMKPVSLSLSFTKKGDLSLSFVFFSKDEVKALKSTDSSFGVEAKVWEKDSEEGTSRTLAKEYNPVRDRAVCIRAALTGAQRTV